jgi:hypothetical protein
MQYLDLMNNVLTRLREDSITDSTLSTNNDPYIRSIGAHVNDAKDRVEDAWQWSALRGADTVPLNTPAAGDAILPSYELPNSADNHYIIKGVYAFDTALANPSYYPVRWIAKGDMIQRYSAGSAQVPFGNPSYVTVNRTDSLTGNLIVSIYPQQEDTTTMALVVDRVAHQPPLVLATDRLLVPSLPVYTLATALASRERGEVGGTPTSELFAIADRHLADAIAQDSALYPSELDWYADNRLFNTNVKFA